jgi:predicted nucleic acid-binding protein
VNTPLVSSDTLSRCVVDASVGIKLFVDEPLSEQAHWLFEKLLLDPPVELYVPDLFFIECTNILWKYTHRYKRPVKDSLADLADLGHLALRVTSTADLMEDALSLAVQTGLTAYDACYAALARRLEIPVVTADEPVCQAIDWAVWLGYLEFHER